MEPMVSHGILSRRREREDRARDLLAMVGLGEDQFYRYPHECSGGQRQRIGLARALAMDPRLIICDESVSSLDASIQAQTLNLLKDLQDTLKLTYMFISHDLSVVRFMSDRILVMDQGRIVEEGGVEQICFHPQHPYIRKLVDAVPGWNPGAGNTT